MKIELSADFILNKFSNEFSMDGLYANLSCNIDDTDWIELALNSLGIQYDTDEYNEMNYGVVRFANNKRFNCSDIEYISNMEFDSDNDMISYYITICKSLGYSYDRSSIVDATCLSKEVVDSYFIKDIRKEKLEKLVSDSDSEGILQQLI